MDQEESGDAGAEFARPANTSSKANRTRYYSAIKTGMMHMNPGVRSSFLVEPTEAAPLPQLLPNAAFSQETGSKASSLVIVFSFWNTMVGSSLVLLPGAFQKAGILLGFILTTISFLSCYYTCAIIIQTAGQDQDYVFTLRKIYGALGFNVGLIGTLIICQSASTIYFNVVATNLYPLLWLVLSTFTDL